MARKKKVPVWKKIVKGIVGTVIPFLGISFMWSRKCRWPRAVKYAVSAAALGAFVYVIFLIPMPTNVRSGGVTFESSRVDVYGPSRPNSLDTDYIYVSHDNGESVISTSAEELENNTIYVYVSDNQNYYHRYTCRFAYDSGNRITLYEATVLGYPPCPLCEPPVYSVEDQG